MRCAGASRRYSDTGARSQNQKVQAFKMDGSGERIRTAEWRFCRPLCIAIRPENTSELLTVFATVILDQHRFFTVVLGKFSESSRTAWPIPGNAYFDGHH